MSIMSKIDREKLAELAEKRDIAYLALFGSVARGDAAFHSDIDVAIRFAHPVTLFDYTAIQLEMEQLLGRSIDLVPIDDLYSFVRDSMSSDIIVLYEAPQDAPLTKTR